MISPLEEKGLIVGLLALSEISPRLIFSTAVTLLYFSRGATGLLPTIDDDDDDESRSKCSSSCSLTADSGLHGKGGGGVSFVSEPQVEFSPHFGFTDETDILWVASVDRMWRWRSSFTRRAMKRRSSRPM